MTRPTDWKWDFGDGYIVSGIQNPSHVFATSGHYNVILSAINAYGISVFSAIDYIHASSVMQATFTATPASGETPLTVQFNSEISGAPDRIIWNFGDGSILEGELNPVHIYDIGTKTNVRDAFFDVSLTLSAT